MQWLAGKLSRTDWRKVGEGLGFNNDKLNNIQDNTNGGPEEEAFQMLLTWKRENGQAATYNKLGEALENAGRTDRREELFDRGKTCQLSRISFINLF